jgi:hypothetical protein
MSSLQAANQMDQKECGLCRCGNDWRDTNAPKLAESDTAVSRLIYQHLKFLPPEISTAHNPLYALDLNLTLDALLFIASQQEGHTDVSGRILVRKDTGEIHDRLLRSFGVFDV